MQCRCNWLIAFPDVEHIEGAIHAKRSDKVAGIESGEFRKLLEPVIGIQGRIV